MFLAIIKFNTQAKIACIMFFLFLTTIVNAQVGIGTATPKAALDVVGGANNYGFLMPRVILTATNVVAPVTNPAGGALEIGTMVFNTATNAGTYGVTPGFYFWDGTRWVSILHKTYKVNFDQTSDLTTSKTEGVYKNINGLNNKTFVAPYDGEYQIIFTGYLGATKVSDITTYLSGSDHISGYSATGYVEGNFRLSVGATNYDKYSYSLSMYRSSNGTNGANGSYHYELFNEVNIIVTVNLTAGTTYILNGAYKADGEDNVTGSYPHVVGSTTSLLGNKCGINVVYMGRQ